MPQTPDPLRRWDERKVGLVRDFLRNAVTNALRVVEIIEKGLHNKTPSPEQPSPSVPPRKTSPGQ